MNRFRSLRVRLLLPLLAVALLASCGVAVGSYMLGDRWARDQIATRYQGIESTLSTSSFPLTQQVVASIADLTHSDLITIDSRGVVAQSSLGLERGSAVPDMSLDASEGTSDELVLIGKTLFRYGLFDRHVRTSDGAAKVAVLFDESELRASRLRMASLPLVTGLSTVILLTSVTLLFASRLIRRLSRLQQRVNRIAEGDFDTNVPIGDHDEVGMLGTAVAQMSDQLRQMRTTLQRQQGEKLLHQLAGGLAHQLRNSVTGARMAVELHQQSCEATDDSMAVALSQLEQTEGHVRRLLMAASGQQDNDHPQQVAECLRDAMRTLSGTAMHLRVRLDAKLDDELASVTVTDGPSLHAALTNLVLNAMQEGDVVNVVGELVESDQVTITVIDNGDGPPEEVATEIFEPFVTSKPEGLGLGLPLVVRSARRLGGEVRWERRDDRTRFTLNVRVTQVAE